MAALPSTIYADPTTESIFHILARTHPGMSLDPLEWAVGVRAIVRDWVRFPFVVVDLFAGAGGSSTGIKRALEALGHPNIVLIQVNHWDRSVQTQILNFPNAIHRNSSVETTDPRELVPWGYIDLLVASPECITYSPARGLKKIQEQSRSSAAFVLTWLELLTVERFFFENVKEWRTWGRMNKAGTRTLKGYEGEYYRAFIRRLKTIGYRRPVEAVINAADHGSPTCRRRLFVFGRRGHAAVDVPRPTHTQFPELYADLLAWRVARDIIDFNDKGESIFDRYDRHGNPLGPHAPASLRRARVGFVKQQAERPIAAAYMCAYDLFVQVSQVFHDSRPPTQASLKAAKPATAEKWRTRYGLRALGGKMRTKEVALVLLASAKEWRAQYSLTGEGILRARERKAILTINIARAREETMAIFSSAIMHFEESDLISAQNMEVDAFTYANRTHSVGRGTSKAPLHAVTSAGGGGLTLVQPTIFGQHGGSVAREVSETPLMAVASGGAISLTQSAIGQIDDAARLAGSVPALFPEPVIHAINHGRNDTREYSLDGPLMTGTQKGSTAISTPLISAEPLPMELLTAGADTDGGTPYASESSASRYSPAAPFIAQMYSGFDEGGLARTIVSCDAPVPNVTAGGQHSTLVQPTLQLVPAHDTQARSADSGSALMEAATSLSPIILNRHGDKSEKHNRATTVDEPLPVATKSGAGYVISPKAIACAKNGPDSGDVLITNIEFKPKITIGEHVYVLDVFSRMLRNRELARSADLIDERRGYDFVFAGTESEVTCQIGNAVPSNVAEALTLTLCKDVARANAFRSNLTLATVNPTHSVSLSETPAQQAPAVGAPFGFYGETIVRLERADRPESPSWFNPKKHPNHVGIHPPGGPHYYIELALDKTARVAAHPFDRIILAESEAYERLGSQEIREDAAA